MRFLKGYVRLIDAMSEKIGDAVSWVTTLMVLVVCYDVLTRYLLKTSSVAVQELEWHLFAIVFLLGAAFTLKHDRHVRVDVIYMKLSPKARAWIDLFGHILFLIPFSILVIWVSQKFVINSFNIRETSPDPGGLPARYLLKAAIPLGFVFILLQGISQAFKSLILIAQPGSQPEPLND